MNKVEQGSMNKKVLIEVEKKHLKCVLRPPALHGMFTSLVSSTHQPVNVSLNTEDFLKKKSHQILQDQNQYYNYKSHII